MGGSCGGPGGIGTVGTAKDSFRRGLPSVGRRTVSTSARFFVGADSTSRRFFGDICREGSESRDGFGGRGSVGLTVVSFSTSCFCSCGGGPNILEYTSYRGVVFSVTTGLLKLSKTNLNPPRGVPFNGLALMAICFFGDIIAFPIDPGLVGDRDRTNGVSSPSTRRRLVGAGVTGDCNLLATKLGGISAGVLLRTSRLGDGDGSVSSTD